LGIRQPAPHLDIGLAAVLRQEVAIERKILVAEERACPAVAALGHVMRNAGDDGAGETGHGTPSARWGVMSKV